MGKLLLDSLEITNFRGFRHLQIPRLGRVNLLVGQNNVGKTSVLEALQFYAHRAAPDLIWEMLNGRNERKYASRGGGGNRFTATERNADIIDVLVSLAYLFYGRRDIKENPVSIRIGAKDDPDNTLSFAIGWYGQRIDEEGIIRRVRVQPDEYNSVDDVNPRFTVQLGKSLEVDYALNPFSASRVSRTQLPEIKCVARAAGGLTTRLTDQLWDHISLTTLESEVLTALRIIAPGVEGLSLVSDPASLRDRFPIVKITGIDEPLPLSHLGDGMQRMFGIALALVNAKDGMLLIDEIENGLHYAVLADLWQLIFQLAHRLNIQIFATTHSWDCIEAFQKVAQTDQQEEGVLIRLDAKKDDIGVTLFDERELGIATREGIEVR